MIAVDTNILVYAHRADSKWHIPAARCLRWLAEGAAPWAIPWPCVHEFIGIVTHPRIYEPPTDLEAALAQVDAWLDSPTVVLLSEREDYWPVLRMTAAKAKSVGPMVHDARIAALCRYHGVRELWSADRDFGRFVDIKVSNPLLRPE
jgi:toxin-antitoxin system PIN domain toxin